MTPQAAGGITVGAVLAGGTGVGAYMLATRAGDPVTLKQVLERVNNDDYRGNTKLVNQGTNKDFLVANVQENQDWWNARFEKYKSSQTNKLDSPASDNFQQVNKGYHNTDANALNIVCDTAYKADKSGFALDTGTGEDEKNYRKDVEKFCTVKGEEKLTV
ncbi:hypothetical protein [Candidatus Mycoplasma haematohominis]|uniref:Uncharacterized protein n=1 Tax=Candidatus Mycoplasma haematohominis TaxID=1494318 RepID=A0A478FPZ1_9MOLU|nr:hypothetical protein [Candidatus Mycoplasma haemohominis]GCE63511.1 hypothetical protein MHSWG343_05080 [Candidatus Mycoplasma haemohominis]